MNPHEDDERDSWRYPDIERIEGGVVTTVNEHVKGDDVAHEVWVKPDSYEGDLTTEMVVGATGDVLMPEEGQRVLLAHRTDAKPIILAARYQEGKENDDVPPFKEGERRIGHPTTDAHVRYRVDDTLVVASHHGNSDLKDDKPDLDVKDDDSLILNWHDQYHDIRLKDDGRMAINADDASSHLTLANDDSVGINWTDDDVDIRLKNNGNVIVNGANGTTLKLESDGTVTINEGNTQPMMDISFGTDSDGHYISHTITRADNVYLPSQ